MAGKSTVGNSTHASRLGDQIPEFCLPAETVASLSEVLGRKLSPTETESIREGVEILKEVALVARSNKSTIQDTLATLRAVSQLAEEDAYEAIRRIDESSYAALTVEMLSGRSVKSAAEAAAAKLITRKSAGGRPSKRYRLFIVSFALHQWRELGQSDLAVHVQNKDRDSAASPLVRWTVILLGICDASAKFIVPNQAAKHLSELLNPKEKLK